MTKREKIIKYLADNGIDILKYERKNSRYAKSGTIVIGGYRSANADVYRAVSDLTGYDPATGEMRPIALKVPYAKDAWGNVDWFTRDFTEERIIWVGK